MSGTLTFAAIGDVATGLEPPEAIFDNVRSVLQSADLRFAQCERLYSERGTFQQQGLAPARSFDQGAVKVPEDGRRCFFCCQYSSSANLLYTFPLC